MQAGIVDLVVGLVRVHAAPPARLALGRFRGVFVPLRERAGGDAAPLRGLSGIV